MTTKRARIAADGGEALSDAPRRISPPGPMDARMARSAKALREAFLALLDRKPLDQITIREIAAEAGVHYATFFRHHPTKEALLDHVAADQIDRLVELTLPVLEITDHHAGFVTLCAYIDDHRKLWTALLTGGAAGAMREELLRVSREVAVSHAHPNLWLPVDLGVACTVGMIVEVISWWLRQPPEAYSSGQIAGILNRLLSNAMLLDSDLGAAGRGPATPV